MKTKVSTRKAIISLMSLALCVVMMISMSACKKEVTPEEATGIWSDAVYTENTVLGEGSTTFDVKVVVGDNSVKLTINTDEETVGAALVKVGVVSGEEGPYGLYVKSVNGITADYDTDSAYWAFHKNGELASTGVDGETIDVAAEYELVYTKG